MNLYTIAAKLFPSRCREIPAMDGGVLLQQIRLSKNTYIHHFTKPEPVDIFHVHRWHKMRSFVLWGSYVEQRLFANRKTKKIKHKAFSTFTMDKSVVHRIDSWDNCWTIFYFGESDDDWGYLDLDMNYTPWQDYIPPEKIVKSI